MRRLKRFEYWNNDDFDLGAKVLQRLKHEERENLLNDKSLQIFSSGKNHYGFQLTFSEPPKSIIYINWKEFEKESDEKIICHIDHEIRRYFAGSGESGLWEKKANDRLKRWGNFNEIIFKYCHGALSPWIDKVLQKLQPEKGVELLNDKSLRIISISEKRNGFYLKFREPVKSIIYINLEEIKKSAKEKQSNEEEYIIYSIAHEIGHHFAGRGESGLLEKEANDWLENWGDFKEIIEKVKHLAPIREKNGYIIGYEVARSEDSKELWKIYQPFLRLWNDKKLKRWEEHELEEELLIASTPHRITALNEHKEETDNDDIRKGIAYGIMKRVRELDRQGV